jgi:Tfp pilus assembly protein PilO
MRILAIILALALPPAIYFPTLNAQHDAEIKRADSEIRELDMRIEQAHAVQRKTAQFHAEVSRLDEELAKLRRILPPAASIDEVRALTEERAAAHGVRVTRFDVGSQSINAEVIGPAEATSEFFRDIANAARIIDVDYVTLRQDPAGWRTDFVMIAYALPD